jgi:hypothetical protein
MKLLREAMEGILLPERVSQTIFEALGEGGGAIPERGVDLASFVQGPLTRALARRLDEDAMRVVLERLQAIITSVVSSEHNEKRIAAARRTRSPDDDLTTRPRLRESSAYVLVIAAHDWLERRLKLSLGEGLGASTAKGMVDVHAGILARSPRLVVIDATDPVDMRAQDVARALARTTWDSLTVVWGRDETFGRDLLRAVADATPAPMGLDLRDGVEPLLDLARSHGTPS